MIPVHAFLYRAWFGPPSPQFRFLLRIEGFSFSKIVFGLLFIAFAAVWISARWTTKSISLLRPSRRYYCLWRANKKTCTGSELLRSRAFLSPVSGPKNGQIQSEQVDPALQHLRRLPFAFSISKDVTQFRLIHLLRRTKEQVFVAFNVSSTV